MRGSLRHLLVISGALAFQLLVGASAQAVISNGMPAMDEIGQYDANNTSTLVPIFTKGGSLNTNNRPNRFGFNIPSGRSLALDTTSHRLFIPDFNNHRVLVFNLNNDNTMGDKIPDFVLGQPDFNGKATALTQSGMNGPDSAFYDPSGQRLFIGEQNNHRVLVFNLSGGITNGMNASFVLGQPDFITNNSTTTQSGMGSPGGVAYDSGNQRLFIAEINAGVRVLVFDISGGISNGMNATWVLGKADFTSTGTATTQAGMAFPTGLVYVSSGARLFVSDGSNQRVLVYSLAAGISNGMNAAYVIGQVDFNSAAAATTQAGMRSPIGLAYDSVGARLFVVNSNVSNNRVTVYDLSATATTNMNASWVIGQPDFTTGTQNTTQNGLNSPDGAAYDSGNQRLYVGEFNNNRVMVYDVAVISTPEPAIDEIGQYDANSTDPFTTTVIYTKSVASNGPSRIALSVANIGAPDLDSVHHRLFVPDNVNNRVLIFNLNNDNTLTDHIADFVLGQPDFNGIVAATTQVGMSSPRNTLYDSANDRLFVGDVTNNRVLVFSLSAGISNGMNAAYVLGQANFISAGAATTSIGMSGPRGLAYDSDNKRLFVVDLTNNRVLQFDLSATTTTNLAAAHVLGQANFTSGGAAVTQTGMGSPVSVAYDATLRRLFVSQSTSTNRVTTYDLTGGVTDGMAASYVLGQPDFTTGTAVTTQAGMNVPAYLAYDSANRRLFVSETTGNRVTVFDLSATTTNGMNAQYVIGQANFTSSAVATTQAGLSGPGGLLYEAVSQRLYAGDQVNNRVMIYDVAPASGGAAHCPSYHLALSRPLGGESWKSGNTENILWTLDGCQTTHLTISLSTDGGLTYSAINDTTNFSQGFYSWKVPDVTTTSAKIRIQGFGPGNTVLGTATSGAFTLTGSSTGSPMNPVTSPTTTPETAPPTPPPAGTGCTQDTLIKASTPAVYWCGFDAKRHVFPNEAVFFSWYKDFKGVITMSDSQLASVPLGRNVTFHPGVLLKLQTDPKVYVVGDKEGLLHPIPDEATAKRLYGPKWNTHIKDLSEAFFTDYTVGEVAQ